MNFLLKSLKSLTKFELGLWVSSVVIISLSFLIASANDYWTLTTSLIGATALIFVSKGNVLGQILTVLFALFYGVVSFSFGYYGEMITYLGMTAPVAVAAVVTWIKNPYQGNRADVKINTLHRAEYYFMSLLGIFVTAIFYFLLRALGTKNLVFSTISVFTSFIPCYLTVCRSEFYAIGYALNDIILIILWTLATLKNLNYLSMVVCFVVFFINDIYGFFKWSKNKKRQHCKSC